MGVSDILQLVGISGGSGFAIFMLILFIRADIVPRSRIEEKDKEVQLYKAERDEWKRAWELERARSDAQVQASYVVKELAQGIRKEINS